MIEESLSSRGRQADRLYSKFLIRQRDKSPPSQSALAEQMSQMNSSQPSFKPYKKQLKKGDKTKVNFNDSIDGDTQQSQIGGGMMGTVSS